MAEASSPAGAENTGNQPAGTEAGGIPPNANANGGQAAEQAKPTSNNSMIPKSRFDEVNAKAKEYEARIAEYEAEAEQRRQAALSDEEKRNEELAALRKQVEAGETLKAQLEAERAASVQMAQQQLDSLPEETKNKVTAYAKAKGIKEDDAKGVYQEYMALKSAGLLDAQSSTKPPPPSTHAGRSSQAGNPDLDPSTAAGARALLRQSTGR